MNKGLFFLTLLTAAITVTGCSSFHKLSKHNQFASDDMVVYYNSNVRLQSHTFGDFKFANSQREFKKITKERPLFQNILLYAKTYRPEYEYYILLNAKPVKDPNFLVKELIIDKNKITLVISKNAPADDIKVITGELLEMNNINSYNAD